MVALTLCVMGNALREASAGALSTAPNVWITTSRWPAGLRPYNNSNNNNDNSNECCQSANQGTQEKEQPGSLDLVQCKGVGQSWLKSDPGVGKTKNCIGAEVRS